jgi:hypothetical protein
VKFMNLETIDGVGLLAYAGLGATARGTQPSDWMSDNVVGPCTKRHRCRFTSHQRNDDPDSPSLRLAVGGSGGAYLATHDGSVGPRSIVIWRRRPDARPGLPGGSQQFYTGLARDRDRDTHSIPTIANGMDVQALFGVITGQIQKRIASHGYGAGGPLDVDMDETNRLFAELPWEPDENLR